MNCLVHWSAAVMLSFASMSGVALAAQESEEIEIELTQSLEQEIDEVLGEVEEEHQHEGHDEHGEHADHEDQGVKGSITINGHKMDFDSEQVEEWVEENSEQLEAWAERHASEWEKWAEGYEYKMERWAETAEKDFEGWAEKYSKRWEDWAEKLEAGDIDADQLSKLAQNNLKMLSDMPLGDLIDGALKEGLGGLEDAPFESLGELNELFSGAIEQSLQAMEKEVAGLTTAEMKRRMGKMKTDDLSAALEKLQSAMMSKQKNLESKSDSKLRKLEALLNDNDELGSREKEAIMKALKKELQSDFFGAETKSRSLMSEEKNAKEEAMKAYKKAIEMKRRFADEAEMKKAMSKDQAAAKQAAILVEKAAAMSAEKQTLEKTYRNLKRQKEELEGKESEIEIMRREIMQLRKEVEMMKKKKKPNKRDRT